MINDIPYSLLGINELPQPERDRLYRRLIPRDLLTEFGINPRTLADAAGVPLVHFKASQGRGTIEVEVRHVPNAPDPVLYVQLADTLNMQIELLLVVINDPRGPRFDTDRMPDGQTTHFGTETRNLPAEEAALRAGLAPGQVRPGLRYGGRVIGCIDDFVGTLGHALWMLQPLAYHNAVLFEHWGFTYMKGIRRMQRWDAEFRPGGPLHTRLDGSTPFRQPNAWRTIRGRSWAIQDGILDERFTDMQMYKQVGRKAGVSTFPDGIW
jgi:hypothetical protein